MAKQKATQTELTTELSNPKTDTKGNLTHLQDKDRVVKISKRDTKNEIIQEEVKASDYDVIFETIEKGLKVTKDASRFIHYVERNQELLTNRKNLEEALFEERAVKIIDTASFTKAAMIKFLIPVDESENGELEYNFDVSKFDSSAVFSILSNIDEKLIEERFDYLLKGDNNVPLSGIEKKRKIKSLIKDFTSVRLGGVFISAKDILHIPNFKKINIDSI